VNRKNLLVVVAALAIAAGIYSFRFHRRQSSPANHALAPDFSLPDLSGQQIRMSDYRGKVVLLDF